MIKKTIAFVTFMGILYLAFDFYETYFPESPIEPTTEKPKDKGDYPMKPAPVPSPKSKYQDTENWMPSSTSGEIVKHKAFTLSYKEEDEVAEWVAYRLTPEMLSQEREYKRSDNFRIDPLVKNGSASPKDYSKTGCDRGHLCPAEDFAYDWDFMDETFFMSNMAPQLPEFNRGIWRELEENVRRWALKYGELYIVTGPILKDADEFIGENKVTYPKSFYKIVYNKDPKNPKAIAYIIPNKMCTKVLDEYVVSIKDVENATDLHFFNNWANTNLEKLKDKLYIEEWKSNKDLYKSRMGIWMKQ
jgi:endonuclease G, mitochondrial